MIDNDKTCRIFAEAAGKASGRIAVYGTGRYGAVLAKHCHEKIFCFCDGVRENGIFGGKPVYSLHELPSLGVKTVVIAAGASGERIVYERINAFCHRERIALYGVQTGCMEEIGRDIAGSLCGRKLRECLWEEIEKHEVICFDVFDTIVMRRTLYPMDVFDIVEHRARRKGIHLPEGFRNYRNQAEVGEERKKTGIRSIYQLLGKMLSLSEAEADAVMEMELDAEREVLIPRSGILEAMLYAKSIGKKVLLVSDMYLSSDFLGSILQEKGLGIFDKLYVSEERGTSKGESLFALVRKENPAASYLHIGDNKEVDGWGARRWGLDSCVIKSAVETFRTFPESRPFRHLGTFNERLLVGNFLVQAFNDPFEINEKGQREVRDIPDFAGLFLAPLAASFITWMIHKVSRVSPDKVLFAARDGYLFHQLYEEAAETWGWYMPKAIYFYASRKLYIGFALKTKEDIYWMQNKLQGGTRKFVRDVFEIELESDDDDTDALLQELVQHKEELFRKSLRKRERFRKYIEKMGLVLEGRQVFFELTSQGTSQYALCQSFFKNLYGLYVHRYNSREAATMGKVESFLPQDKSPMLINNVFEFVFTSPEASAKDIEEDGSFIFESEARTDEEIAESLAAQEAVREYFRGFVSLVNPEGSITNMVGQQILDLYRSGVFSGCINIFDGRAISNDLVGGRLCV